MRDCRSIWTTYVVPGLVIQAVMVGGGYATGRELVEFFLSIGTASGLLGMTITALLFSLCAMTAFELARLYRVYDYDSLCRVFLGRFAILFEIGYLAALLLALAVVTAAAGAMTHELAGYPEWVGSLLFMLVVAVFAYAGTGIIERVISAWSLIFYTSYGTLFVITFLYHSADMASAIAAQPVRFWPAIVNGVSYTSYNITVVAILIFVARHFHTRREAIVAGAVAGPLILLPGLALLLTLSAFSARTIDVELPISAVIGALGMPVFALIVRLIVLVALVKTGVGLLHGLNERLARASAARGVPMHRLSRPALAIVAMAGALYGATAIGLIDLIAQGYRYSAAYFACVFLAPLLTIGAWRVARARA